MRFLAAMALTVLGMTPAASQPPPPGWDAAHRARACLAEPSSTPIFLKANPLGEKAAGVSVPSSSPIRFAWAVDLGLKDVGVEVGLTYSQSEGIVLATSAGRWIRIVDPEKGITSTTTGLSYEIADGSHPVALAAAFGGTFASIQADRSTVALYDVGTCGFGARALPAFRLESGAQATTIGAVSPNLGGFANSDYILVAGRKDGRVGEVAAYPADGAPIRPFGPAFVDAGLGRSLVLLSALDLAGGCDGVAGISDAAGRTVLRTFCSPGFSDEPTLVLGDVSLPGRRTPAGIRKPIDLVTVVGQVRGAVEGWALNGRVVLLLLTAPAPGIVRIIALDGPPASYRTGHP